MKSKKELKREYIERPKPAGVFQIKNIANGKVLLGSSLNLEGSLNKHRFMLMAGSHRNKALQQDWNNAEPAMFEFDILETVKVTDAPGFKLSDELTLLEQIWLEELQPVGDNGYNVDEKIREA